jgi:hypothetical protein
MPVSKRRKNSKGKRRTITPLVPVKTERWNVKLNGSRLLNIRNDPDFLTIIKIGRVMNAVAYGVTDIGSYNVNTALCTRQYRRALFVLGGYLHQSITLVSAIKGRYLTEPGFEPLRLIALDSEHKKARDYVRKIRNFTAFHSDEYDETTRQTLSRLKPMTYPFMSGDDDTAGTFYFEFSDYIDLAFLVDTFANGRSFEETSEDILVSIMDLAYKFLTACHEFLHALCTKIKITEHVYK